jgi:hypothetical protein
MKTKLMLAALLLLGPFAPGIFADQLVYNGGFEYPDTTYGAKPDGWNTSGSDVLTIKTFASLIEPSVFPEPHSGVRMAVMSNSGIHDSDLWQIVDFTGYSTATLSFSFRYEGIQLSDDQIGQDLAQVYIGEWLLGEAPIDIDNVNEYFLSGWMPVSLPFNVTGLGEQSLRFHLQNAAPYGEELQKTAIFLDDVSIEAAAIPEPTSLWLLGSGLAIFGLAAWRRRQQ